MPRYLLKVGDNVTGPHSEAALQEMASVRVFDEEALLAPEATEDWRAVGELPELCAKFFPPRKTISLKAKAIETVNQANDEPVSVDQILKENLAAEANLPRKPFRRIPNRRRRDFLAAIIIVDGALGAAWYYLPRSQEIQVALISAAALLTLGLYWLFYQIMDRY
ncbi:MAG: DUF4339 domain-containing protein [Nibricoccus sp.]